MLTEKEKYLECGIHIGTTSKIRDMERFIYKILPNGLAVLNLSVLDKRIKAAALLLSKYSNILVVGKKVKKPLQTFAETVDAKVITGRFMPGSLTNPSYVNFFEPDIILLTDPFIDRNALKEAVKMRIPVIALCNTFNQTKFIDLVIPCNNKGKNSLAMIFFLLSREILKIRGKIKNNEEFNLKLDDFKELKEKV